MPDLVGPTRTLCGSRRWNLPPRHQDSKKGKISNFLGVVFMRMRRFIECMNREGRKAVKETEGIAGLQTPKLAKKRIKRKKNFRFS